MPLVLLTILTTLKSALASASARVWPWVKAHGPLVLAVVCVVAAFVLGRCSGHARVVTKTEVKTVVKTVTVQAKSEVQFKDRVVYRDRTRIIRKDGTVIQRDVVRTEAEQKQVKTEVKAEGRSTATEKLVEDKPLAEPKKPNLSVDALVGADFGKGGLKPVFGGEAAYRVWGPMWLGLWGQGGPEVTPRAGFSLRFEF